MKRTLLIAILFSWILPWLFSAPPPSKSTLEIRFEGIRTSKGMIAIGINTSEEGWPRKPQMELQWVKGELKDGVFVARIPDLPYGTYAVSVLDDENSNLEMDMVLGIPKEGWGFSENPPFKLSAPKFSECAFKINQPVHQITISLRYAGKGK